MFRARFAARSRRFERLDAAHRSKLDFASKLRDSNLRSSLAPRCALTRDLCQLAQRVAAHTHRVSGPTSSRCWEATNDLHARNDTRYRSSRDNPSCDRRRRLAYSHRSIRKSNRQEGSCIESWRPSRIARALRMVLDKSDTTHALPSIVELLSRAP